MTRVFDESGTSIPVTVINIDSNRISQIKTIERDGYSAVQIAYGHQKESRLNKATLVITKNQILVLQRYKLSLE